jgi:tRNA G26 N,N-dimethylase Trm1
MPNRTKCILLCACALLQDGARVLEGLAASGLRAIRYAKEVQGIGRIDANDLDASVVEAMARNVEFNGPEASARVRPRQGDARLVMMQNPGVRPEAGAWHAELDSWSLFSPCMPRRGDTLLGLDAERRSIA